MNCINFKQYTERTLNFLSRKQELTQNIGEKITDIVEFSIAVEDNNFEVSMYVRMIQRENIITNKYQSKYFVSEIRKNRKHFINVFREKFQL